MAQQVGSMSVFITRCTNNLLPLPNITIICQASTAQNLRNIWYTSLSLCILSSQHKFYLDICLSSRSFFITHRAALAKACNSSKVAAGPVKVVVPGGACGWNIGEFCFSTCVCVCMVGDSNVKHINNNIMVYVEQNSMVPSSNRNANAHDLKLLFRFVSYEYIIDVMHFKNEWIYESPQRIQMMDIRSFSHNSPRHLQNSAIQHHLTDIIAAWPFLREQTVLVPHVLILKQSNVTKGCNQWNNVTSNCLIAWYDMWYQRSDNMQCEQQTILIHPIQKHWRHCAVGGWNPVPLAIQKQTQHVGARLDLSMLWLVFWETRHVEWGWNKKSSALR